MSASSPMPSPGLRVAMVIQRFRPRFGGQGVQLELIAGELSRRGHDVTVVTLRPPGAPAIEALDGYRVRRVGTTEGGGAIRGLRFAAGVARAVSGLRPHVVHVHGLTDGLYGAWVGARLKRATLIFEMTLLGDDDATAVRANPARPAALRWQVFRRCDAFVAMSETFRGPYAAEQLPPERLHLVPQAVDTERFQPADPQTRQRARAAVGLTGGGPVVAFVGSLIERKGLDILLTAWEQICRRHSNAVLVLIGKDEFEGGSAEAEFLAVQRERIAEFASSVRVLGQRDDPETILQAADIFAFPSRREGFGTVIIEAMATGLPCVVAELPGITDMIFERGATGLARDGVVVPQNDPEALAAALGELLLDATRRTAIGERARQRVLEHFDVGDVVTRYERLYGDLLGGNPR